MKKDEADMPERIAKRIARAGVCSRREAEALILAGKVRVNGKTITTPALNITSSDTLIVNGNVLSDKEKIKLYLYHKPAGLVTTHKDPQGRPTVFSALPKEVGRVISVGRLDLNTEGLLLLTNDGALARHLELPSTGWVRKYKARIYGNLSDEVKEKLKDGVTVNGVRYNGITVEVERKTGANAWVNVSLREGKNREIRNVFEHFGCSVNRLIRTAYGPFQLGSLSKGAVKEVPLHTLKTLLPKSLFD